MSKDLTQYVTTRRAAELLGVDRTHVNRLLIEKRIKGIKPGHDWLVYLPSLEKYFNTKAASGKPSSRPPKLGTSAPE